MAREYTCRHCGEKFTVTKTEQETIDEGWVEPPDTCSECFDMMDLPPQEEPYSDADNGL